MHSTNWLNPQSCYYFFKLIFTFLCLPALVHAWLPGGQEEGVQFLGTEVTDGWERPLGVGGQEEGVQFLGTGTTDGWKLEVRLSPLEEQARSSTSPSAPLFSIFGNKVSL